MPCELVPAGEAMTCADFFIAYCDDADWNMMCDEFYWGDSFSSDACFDWLRARADRESVHLTDVDTWDYDSYFWNTYRDTEKGLS